MRRIVAILICIAILAASPLLMLPVSADQDASQPAGDDIFFNSPGGSEYTSEASDDADNDPNDLWAGVDLDWLYNGDMEEEEELSPGTIALISISALTLACIAGGWIYFLIRKRKK